MTTDLTSFLRVFHYEQVISRDFFYSLNHIYEFCFFFKGGFGGLDIRGGAAAEMNAAADDEW